MAHSSASRAAVENLTKVLATEWSRFRIGLVAIAAGHFGTDTFMSKYPESVVEASAGTIPAQRLGRSEEVAWLAAYLASPAADYLTGTTITIDGGRDNWLGPWPPGSHADDEGRIVSEARRPG